MWLPDAYDFVSIKRPEKEPSSQEKAQWNRQGIFRSEATERGCQVGYQAPACENDHMCRLDERGAHLRVSKWCPHGLLTADFETVTEVVL